MSGITDNGKLFLLQQIADKVSSGEWVIGVFNGDDLVKTINAVANIEELTLKVSALDDSSDEYTFNKITLQDNNGTAYIESSFDSKDKTQNTKLAIELLISFYSEGEQT